MPASSVIFLVILLLCAGSLLPSAIRRRRHSELSRVTDRDSAALRVVVRGGPGSWTAAAPVASSRPVLGSGSVAVQPPATRREPPAAPPAGAHPLRGSAPAGRVAASPMMRTSAASSRVVARRRRLVATVLALTLLGWGAVLVGAAPAWVGALSLLPLAGVVAALGRHGAGTPVRTAPAVHVVVASPREAAAPTGPTVVAASVEEATTVPAQREEPAPAAVEPVVAAGSWAPVPVPLPTYLLKSKAPDRTPPVQRPTVELVVVPLPDEVIDLREPVRAVNE